MRWKVAALVLVAGLLVAVVTRAGPPDPELVERGRAAFQMRGCSACHNLDDRKAVGPPLAHLYGREVQLEGGGSVTADEAYLAESIREPNARITAGYKPQMPFLPVTDEEIEGLVALIQSLR